MRGFSLSAFGFDRYRKANLSAHPFASAIFSSRESILVQIDRKRSAAWSPKVALIPDTRPHQSDPRYRQSIEICALNHFIFFRERSSVSSRQLVTSIVSSKHRYSGAIGNKARLILSPWRSNVLATSNWPLTRKHSVVVWFSRDIRRYFIRTDKRGTFFLF